MTSIFKVKKRDGRVVDFDSEKITAAIWNAAKSVGGEDQEMAVKITTQITTVLEVLFKDPDSAPTVEQIQDLVEKILIEGGHAQTAKAYILYRAERQKERQQKEGLVGLGRAHETMDFSDDVLEILQETYLLRGSNGEVCETPMEMIRRVAHSLATPESQYGNDVHLKESEFYQMIANQEFVPSVTILKNAGVHGGQLADEFVVPIEDSLDGIFKALKDAAVLYKNGGALGFSFSKLRPQSDFVAGKKGVSSGPAAFMKLFAEATGAIRQGDTRLAENVAMLSVEHPDIIGFLEQCNEIDNFGYAVLLTDSFISALKGDGEYDLVSPKSGSKVGTLRARTVFDIIVTYAWKHSNMRVFFGDNISEKNYFKNCGEVEALTPKGRLLLPYEAVYSGVINLAKFQMNDDLDWEKLGQTLDLVVRFLDNAIDLQQSALSEVDKMTEQTRRISIGIAGIGECGNEVMEKVKSMAEDASEKLAIERELCGGWEGSYYQKIGKKMRNFVEVEVSFDSFVDQFLKVEPVKSGRCSGLGLRKVFLEANAAVGDFEKEIFQSYDAGNCGVMISRKSGFAVEIEAPIQMMMNRAHSGGGMVQEVIPPPLVEMSRVVKETLNTDL